MKNSIRIMIIGLLVLSLAVVVSATNRYDTPYLTATLMNQDPDPAEQGEYLDLRWKIEKSGNGQLEDIQYYLELEYPFFFDSSDTPLKVVDDWWGYSDGDAFYTLHYKVRVDEDALEDTYTVKLKSRNSRNSEWAISEYDIRVGDKELSQFAIGTVSSDPTKLVSDTDEAKLEVEIENIGDGDAQNVKMKLDLPTGLSPSYGYSDQDNLGTIEAGSSETATFYIDIDEDVAPKLYPSKVTISYKEANDDDNEYKSLDIPLDIPIIDKPRFDVLEVRTVPKDIHAGDDVELTVVVKNTGGKEAESVSLRAFKESSQPFDFDEKYDFVGKLDSGEIGEGVLKFKAEDGATPKKYILDMEIRYIYNDDVEVRAESVAVNVVNGEDSSVVAQNFKYIIAGIVIVLVIAGLILYQFAYKGNGKRKNRR